MRYLGIDFGKKRIGIAVSDETGRLAFPHSVVPNDKKLFKKIGEIIKDKNISEIIIGESENFTGEPNKIMKEIKKFKKILEEKTELNIHFEPEFMTSSQAKKELGENEMHDASAAAIILQSFLDKKDSML